MRRPLKHSLIKIGNCLLLLAVVAAGQIPSPASAAVSANPAYKASLRVSSSPNQTLTYEITLTKTGTFSHLVLALPANAGTSGFQIGASNLRGGKLERVTGGFVYRTDAPYNIAAGTRLWVMVNGITVPPAGTYSVRITAYATNGTVLAAGTTAGLQFLAAKPCPTSWSNGYIATENALTGSTAWRLGVYDNAAASAFASQTSAKCGDTVTLRINSSAIKVSVVAYRMGYYGGAGSRGVLATSNFIRGYGQPVPLMIKTDAQGREINMPTARNWSQSVSLRIDGSFTPGMYLIKVFNESNRGSYVPLIVRDDTGVHDKLVMHSVATWQAYNRFGGASAYTSPIQSKRVSYDRPLLQNQGTGDFLSLEYGYVYWSEKQGFDQNYIADTDLDSMPGFYDRANTMVLLSHTEYWSTAMRQTVDAGIAQGRNLASMGANQLYWRINPQASSLTGTDREFEIFRTGDTARFRDEPDPHPEQAVLGAMFGCMHMDGTGTPNNTWLWQGVAKAPIPHLAQGEVDKVIPDFPVPAGVQVLTTIPLDACNSVGEVKADIVAVVHPSGSRVFNASTHSWNCMLNGACPYGWVPSSAAQTQLGQATMNAFSWIGEAQAADSSPTSFRFKPQVIGVLRPTSGMPPLEPPVEG
jgi:hypothetical protein